MTIYLVQKIGIVIHTQTDLRVNVGESLDNMLDGTFKLFLTKAGWTGGRISTRLHKHKRDYMYTSPICSYNKHVCIQCKHTEWTKPYTKHTEWVKAHKVAWTMDEASCI